MKDRSGRPCLFTDRPKNKNKNLVEFCSIHFNGFRGEVENVSANQRPGRIQKLHDNVNESL